MVVDTLAGPAIEPVTLDEAKAHLRVDFSDDDDLITALIKTATASLESYTRTRLITQTVQVTADSFLKLRSLPVWPVQSVVSVVYDDLDGVETTWDPALFTHRRSVKPNQIVPAYEETWPHARDHVDAVRVTLVVGYGDAAEDVPAEIRHAMKLMISELYNNRELAVVGASVADAPVTVKTLAHPHIFYP